MILFDKFLYEFDLLFCDDFHHRKEDEIEKEIIQTKSYIDSRIDKVVLQGTLPSRKQLIKK